MAFATLTLQHTVVTQMNLSREFPTINWERVCGITNLGAQYLFITDLKGGFFSESTICFFRSPNLQKKIFQKTILNLKFKFLANYSILLLAGNLNFKLRIVFWNIFFWRFGDLKNESHFLKKSHLYSLTRKDKTTKTKR